MNARRLADGTGKRFPRYRSVHAKLWLLAAMGGVLGSCSSFSDLQQLGESTPTSARCGQCHVEIHDEWQQSAHAAAFRSPVFLAHSDGGRIERCASCHAPQPLGEVAGRPVRARTVARDEGVHCVTCHSVEAEHGAPRPTAVMVGPLGSAAAVSPHPVQAQRDRFRQASFCGRCHEDTLEQWLASAPAGEATCQACHMPSVRRKVTQATGMVSSVLVSLEEELPLRSHDFSSVAALYESVRVLATDFLDLRLSPHNGGVRVEVENRLPHSIPTGGFGGERLTMAIQINGVEAAHQELSTRPGQSLAPGGVAVHDLPLQAGRHHIEVSLTRRPRDPARILTLWKRQVTWDQPEFESYRALSASR